MTIRRAAWAIIALGLALAFVVRRLSVLRIVAVTAALYVGLTIVLASGESLNVTLSQRLPVYIGYFTVASRDGALVFYGDPYRRDAGVIEALDRRESVATAAQPTDQCPS